MVTDNVDATNDSVLSDYYTRSDVVEDSADITPVPVFSSTVVDIEMQDVSVSNTSIDLLVPVFSYTTVDVDMHNNSASNTSIEVESTAVTDTEAVMFTSQNESAPDPSMLEPLDPLHHTSMPSNFKRIVTLRFRSRRPRSIYRLQFPTTLANSRRRNEQR